MPATPVGDGLRQEIYDLYKEDPVKWTPRQLALKYELSVIRIEAILRLKHLEKKQAASVRNRISIGNARDESLLITFVLAVRDSFCSKSLRARWSA